MSNLEAPTALPPAPTDLPEVALSTSSSLPHLDLRQPREQPSVVDVVVKCSALVAGLKTSTCPHCGINPAGPPVKRTFQHVPRWVYIGLFLNIVVLMIMYGLGRRVVKGELSLCADCASADKRGRLIRSLSFGGIVLFPAVLALIGGLALGGEGAVGGALAGLVAFVGGMFAAHHKTRFDVIGCKLIDKKADTMTLTSSPAFVGVLAREAPASLG